ncbi:hypothetical protein ACU6U9_17490 [Pseudomonas sp. HK3]
MRVEARKTFASNGLIDDLVIYGESKDYLQLAELIGNAISSKSPTSLLSKSGITIEIILDYEDELFTSLQNKTNEYYSMNDWNNRNVLRIYGCEKILSALQSFLSDVAKRGDGYSYISEYSKNLGYSRNSPEWRLHVEDT